MSGIESDFRRSFRRLRRAHLRRHLASALVYCFVFSGWSFGTDRLLDQMLGWELSWWWMAGSGSILILVLHLTAIRAWSWDRVKNRNEGLFAHDELSSALDFLERGIRSDFMKAHLIRTGERLERIRLPLLYSFGTGHLVLVLSLGMIWVPPALWLSSEMPGTSEAEPRRAAEVPQAGAPEPLSDFANEPSAIERNATSDNAALTGDYDSGREASAPSGQERGAEPGPAESGTERGELEPAESRRLPDTASSADAGSGPAHEGAVEPDRESRKARPSSGGEARLEREVDRFKLAGDRSAESRTDRSSSARRLRAGLQGAEDSGEKGTQTEEAVSGGTAGAVGWGEGSKKLGPATPITGSFYKAPVKGRAGEGPRVVRQADSPIRQDRTSGRRSSLTAPGSSFSKKQTTPSSYRGLVEKYFLSSRTEPDPPEKP